MQPIDTVHQHIETDMDHYTEKNLPPLQHQWPLLSRSQFILAYLPTTASMTEQDKRKKQEEIRRAIVAQLYQDDAKYALDTHYLAFLLVKQGRGGEIVGRPYAIDHNSQQQELPYTGLEGYYAGSEQREKRPGMSREAILLEEANMGAELLKTIKKHMVEQYSWVNFAHLKHVLEGGKPDKETLNNIQAYWSMIVSRLHVRVYHNPEFEPTLTERIEELGKLLGEVAGRTEEEKHLKEALNKEYTQLRQTYAAMSQDEKEQEIHERKQREEIRASRLEEFHHFREDTYQMLANVDGGHYALDVQATSPEKTMVTETITLPELPARETYPPTYAHFTHEQLEGYLFIAQLGTIGGDPFVRSATATDELDI